MALAEAAPEPAPTVRRSRRRALTTSLDHMEGTMFVSLTASADTGLEHHLTADGRTYVQIGSLSILADADTHERIAAEHIAAANSARGAA